MGILGTMFLILIIVATMIVVVGLLAGILVTTMVVMSHSQQQRPNPHETDASLRAIRYSYHMRPQQNIEIHHHHYAVRDIKGKTNDTD